jgi:hypothetical protein
MLIQTGNPSVVAEVCDRYKIKKKSLSIKALIETIIDREIEILNNVVTQAKNLTKPIQFKEVSVNAIDKFVEARFA